MGDPPTLTSNELEAANRAEATALLIRAGYRVYRPEADGYGEDLVVRTPSGDPSRSGPDRPRVGRSAKRRTQSGRVDSEVRFDTRSRDERTEYALRAHCAVAAVVRGDSGCCSGEHRYRSPQHQHRDQPAGLPGARRGGRLSGLLRSATGRELLLLRWPVLGLPGRPLVRE